MLTRIWHEKLNASPKPIYFVSFSSHIIVSCGKLPALPHIHLLYSNDVIKPHLPPNKDTFWIDPLVSEIFWNCYLKKVKGRWANELPRVLWSYWTTTWTSTGETPFLLAYGTKAVIPTETSIPTARYDWNTEEQNWEELNHELDIIDKKKRKEKEHV